MAECLSQDELQKFAAGEMMAAEMLAADSHVAECAECRGRLIEPNRLALAVNSLVKRSRWDGTLEFNCLDDEQAAAYVKGSLDPTDREIASAHLDGCAACRDDVASLRVFHTEMDSKPAQVYAPLPRPTSRLSLVDSIRRAFAGPVKLVFAFGGATAVLAMLLVYQSTMNGNLRSEIHRLRSDILGMQDSNSRSAAIAREAGEMLKSAQKSIDERDRKVANLEKDLLRKNAVLASAGRSMGSLKDAIVIPVPGGRELPREVARAAGEMLFSGTASMRQPQQIAMLATDGQVVRSDEPVPAPLSPVATLVRARAPYFRWKAVPGAEKHVVTISVDKPRRLFLTIEAYSGTGVSYPVNERSLEPGETYAWRVEAHLGGRTLESPLAKFKVMSTDRKREIDALQAKYSSSPLIVAAILESEGLFDDAETVLTELTRNEPANVAAKVALKKLVSYRSFTSPAE